MSKGLFRALVCLISVMAGVSPANAGTIAIIIDDIGYSYSSGKQVANLHPGLTLSILPDTENAVQLSDYAQNKGREIMLHLPMQSTTGHHASEAATLNLDQSEGEFKASVYDYLSRFPGVSGVNNHMGSLLTRHPGHMGWLMETLNEYPSMYFVDSRTHAATVAAQVAREYAIPSSQRDVFLDNDKESRSAIRQQIRLLGKLATRNDFALGIGHPYRTTISVLREEIPRLLRQGHTIVPVSEYIALKETESCPECSSLLLLAARNSKPLPSLTCCGAAE